MWNWATPERARRSLWVMCKRLTSTRTHKFYTLTILLTFLPLLTLHLLALHNTSTGLTKLSTLLSFTSPSSTSTSNSNSSTGNSSSNSWEGSGSLVPTVIQQDGQGVLRICNLRNVCESVTAVALSATVSTPTSTSALIPPSSTLTPSSTPVTTSQQAGSTGPGGSGGLGGSGGVAGDQGASVLNTGSTTSLSSPTPTNSIPPASPSPDIVVQARPTTRPPPTDSQQPTTSSSSSLVVPALAISSQPPPPISQASPPISQASPPISQASPQVSSVDDGGLLIAAPPTLTSTAPGESSTGLVVGDVPLVIATTSTSTTSNTSTSSSTPSSTASTSITSKKSKDGNSKNGGSTTSTSTSSTNSSSPTPTISVLSTENDATTNKAPASSISTSTRAVSSTDLAVDGNGGPSVFTSTSTTSTSTSLSPSPSSPSTSSTSTSSTSTDTTSTSLTSPDVDPTTESTADVPTTTSTSSESIPSKSDKGDVDGGNGGSTSTTTSTSTSNTPTTTENSDEAIPTETTSTDSASTETTSTDSTPTESKESKESSTTEPSSSNTKETDDEPTTTSTPTSTSTSSDVPDIKRALPLQRRYTGTLYGSPGSAFPLQARSYSSLQARTFSATPIMNGTTGTLEGVDVTDVSDTGGNNVTRLGVVCAISMAFPLSQLRQDWIEDVTMAAFYLCILGVGIAAIINESVAHLITAFLSILFSTLWTSTQLVRTHYSHDQFDAFITRSACSGVDVLPYYWSQRQRLELPILIINILALVLLAGLGFKLLKVYREDTKVKRYVYKVMLVLRCSILLGSFFLFSGTSIWLNFLFTNPGVVVSGTVDMLKGLAIVSLVFGLPWALTGWFALREGGSPGGRRGGKWWGKRMMMGVFIGLDALFLAGWVATFASDVYRAVFLAWTFFAVVSVAAFFVLVGSLGAGVVCWMRFGRELDDFDSEKPRGISVVSTESFGNPAGHLRNSGGDGGGDGLEVPRWDYSNTAEKAWEPFDKASIRQSQFTASDGRESTVFSYGLRSPAPPVPMRPDAYGSSSNPSGAFGLAL